jgi:TonB family protein
MTIMIADPPRRSSLGVGFNAYRGRTGPTEAWKQQIGSRPIPARLALLPEHKPNWGRVGFSAVLQISILCFFVLVPLLYPQGMKTALHFYSATPLAAPITEIPVAPPPPPPPKVKAPQPKLEAKPEVPVDPPKLNPQQPHIFANLATPKPVERKIEKVEIKEPDATPKFDNAMIDAKENGPKRPRDEVKLNNMSNGSAAAASVKAPVDKVQTGGFGDPNGLPGKANPNHPVNVNSFGSTALPPGEGIGNGTGGKQGIPGTVQSTGFGNGTATPSPSGAKKGTVVAGGFASTDTSADAPKKKAGPTGPADNTPEITDKPRPEYTSEGRSLKIEGDVRLEVVFLANGTVQVNRVVSGLGHGLDESAVRAARQIKFKPAKKDGAPVDFPAVIRIEFRLAY